MKGASVGLAMFFLEVSRNHVDLLTIIIQQAAHLGIVHFFYMLCFNIEVF